MCVCWQNPLGLVTETLWECLMWHICNCCVWQAMEYTSRDLARALDKVEHAVRAHSERIPIRELLEICQRAAKAKYSIKTIMITFDNSVILNVTRSTNSCRILTFHCARIITCITLRVSIVSPDGSLNSLYSISFLKLVSENQTKRLNLKQNVPTKLQKVGWLPIARLHIDEN